MIRIALFLLPAGLARTLAYGFSERQVTSQTISLAVIEACLAGANGVRHRRHSIPPYVVAIPLTTRPPRVRGYDINQRHRASGSNPRALARSIAFSIPLRERCTRWQCPDGLPSLRRRTTSSTRGIGTGALPRAEAVRIPDHLGTDWERRLAAEAAVLLEDDLHVQFGPRMFLFGSFSGKLTSGKYFVV